MRLIVVIIVLFIFTKCSTDTQKEFNEMEDMKVYIKNGNEIAAILESNSLNVEDYSGQMNGNYAYVYMLDNGDFLILSADAAINGKKGFLVTNYEGDFREFDVSQLPFFEDGNQDILERNNEYITKHINEMSNATYSLDYFKDNYKKMQTYFLNDKSDEEVITYVLNYMFYLKNTLDLQDSTEVHYGDYFSYKNYIISKGGKRLSIIEVLKSFKDINNDFMSFHKQCFFAFKPGVKLNWI